MSVRDIVQAAAGVGGGGEPTYIEDVFSTYLYTGNGSTQTITNGIDLAGEGGLVWIKRRNGNNTHTLFDSATYTTGQYYLATNLTNGFLDTGLPGLFELTDSGFSVELNAPQWNQTSQTYASWTFRKAPKFFDIVTYTGDGNFSTDREIAHNLGATPGFIIIKATSTTGSWWVWHRSVPDDNAFFASVGLLNTTSDFGGYQGYGTNSKQTDSVFTLRTNTSGRTNDSGVSYVAYLFAHDAGGFGDDGLQNVISCGSYTGTGTDNNTVTLGYEPQWLLIKRTNTTGGWILVDSMRGIATDGVDPYLQANEIDAEFSGTDLVDLRATGFALQGAGNSWNASASTYIYIAIRRGPMKTPTSGTEVFAVDNGNSSDIPAFNSGFPVDMGMTRSTSISTMYLSARLTQGRALVPQSTAAETTLAKSQFDYMSGWINQAEGSTDYGWMFRRAPGFFDVVAYTGTSTAGRSLPHNLQVTPEFIIFKRRNLALGWYVYHKYDATKYLLLNDSAAEASFQLVSAVSSTDVTLPLDGSTNASGSTYVAYLFATLAGVSKVGSYTGTGTTLQVDCGFSAGARFVLIKRTDSTGDWYVWDSARGIVSGNDPYLLLNSTAAEVTSTDYIDPLASGFEISSTAPAAINASGGNFIFLAIA